MKLDIVRNDDWCGIYVDEILITENHTIELEDLLTLLKIPFQSKWVDTGWLFDRGNLPTHLSEVEFE